MSRPLILVDPYPRMLADILDAGMRARLEALGNLVIHEGSPMPTRVIDHHIAEASLLIGQTDLPAARLQQAKSLRAVINVETNFLPNIDYETCFTRGIHVITPGAAFADVVAEAALAMAIDLARGITSADRAFRSGRERYGLAGNDGCFRFGGSPVGIIGFGDLGQQLRRLLVPFRTPVKVYDPWLPEDFLRNQDVEAASLSDLLSSSRIIFVFASATSENQGFLDEAALNRIAPGSAFLLMSRAAVVDFAALVRQGSSGRLKIAVDVFPDEPVSESDPVREVENVLLSAHRTGGMPEALLEIGRMAVADAELILRGLPPVMCRRAQRETVLQMRSKPVATT